MTCCWAISTIRAGTTWPMRCLTCGNCTMVCPTCFCTSVEDASDLAGAGSEPLAALGFLLHDGFLLHSWRQRADSPKSRYRQWMTHKLATWIDQFGTSGCVGCGRCITWCPVGIDITEEVRAIRERPAQRGEAMIEGMDTIVREHRFFAGLDEDTIKLIAGCARNVRFDAGEYLFREDDPADEFYLIRHGRVALDVVAPGRAAITIQTVGRGRGRRRLLAASRPIAGCHDARAVELVRAIGIDAKCLRQKCEADHDLGYDMMMRFVPLLVDRLQATRLQLLDVYGRAWLSRAAAHRRRSDAADRRARSRVRREGADIWTLEIEPGSADFPSRPASSTCSTPSASAKWRSRSAATPPTPATLLHTIRAVGTVSGALTRLKPGDSFGLRGPFGVGWPVEEALVATW